MEDVLYLEVELHSWLAMPCGARPVLSICLGYGYKTNQAKKMVPTECRLQKWRPRVAANGWTHIALLQNHQRTVLYVNGIAQYFTASLAKGPLAAHGMSETIASKLFCCLWGLVVNERIFGIL